MKTASIYASVLLILVGSTSYANWSGSLGYNNPPGATVGLNFMYQWSKWAFEFGAGSIRSNSSSTSVGGDVNFKYFFNGNVIKPYLQFGLGTAVSVSTSDSTAGAGTGGGFGGAGIFLKGNPIYAYGSYNLGNGGGFFQFGVGYDF